MSESAKSILIISALDPSGGAGTSADVKTAKSLGFYPCPVVTAITFQNTCGVYGMHELEEEIVEEQIKSVLEDIKVCAVKLGVGVKKKYVELLREFVSSDYVVYDPVVKSTSGYPFMDVGKCVENAKLCGVITPNREEAYTIARGLGFKDRDLEELCRFIHDKLGCKVVVTGKVDLAYNGKKFERFEREHTGVEVHGTGCVFSTALACYLVEHEFFEAVRLAREFVSLAAKRALRVGKCILVINP